VCNCSALVDTLLESQFLGHVRGSFTGSMNTRPGLLEFANGHTVSLDEIGEASLQMQANLLHVIQNREVRRVGSSLGEKMDVRVMGATNRDLGAELLAGRPREDLLHRLTSIEFHVPGLAKSPEGISVLIQHFLRKYNETYGNPLQGLPRQAQFALLQHDWPGNVRGIEKMILSEAITTNTDFIDVTDLPDHL
jgi:transcriptional regulator with PAS, ATPase and Fis domain